MLKFLVNYLGGQQQRVIIENYNQIQKTFCQVSPRFDFGSPPIVLFINDMADGIDCNTNLAFYAI